MKKHPFIQYDFRCTVKLSPAQKTRLIKWLNMANSVVEKLIHDKKMIHPSWAPKAIRVSILLCGVSKMKGLNSQYRGKDYVTDVLSFPNYQSMRNKMLPNELVLPELFLGDLVICHQKVLAQAQEFQIGYWDELIHLYLHGMIHLFGYDHEISEKEQKIMERWEDRALNLFSELKKRGPKAS